MKYLLLLLIAIQFSCTENKYKKGEFEIQQSLTEPGTYFLKNKVTLKESVYKATKEKIDFQTLKDLGEFLIDRNYVYRYYDISDYTLVLRLDSVDKESFAPFGKSIYAKDRFHIFTSRNGTIEEADVNTFTVIQSENGGEIFGKDKNNYFFWDEVLKDTTGFSRKTTNWDTIPILQKSRSF